MPAQQLNELTSLPCFSRVEQVSSIEAGLSQASFKVRADGKLFFAKFIEQDYLSDEISITGLAAKNHLSPRIIYQDHHWLICTFVEGDNLTNSAISIDKKIHYALTLMSQCHQLDLVKLPLKVSEIIHGLINPSSKQNNAKQCSPALLDLLQQLVSLLEQKLTTNKKLVSCHGDLNFSNILLDVNKRAWLIDYECSCLAPAEFDIAMFIAVNELDVTITQNIILQYQQRQIGQQLQQSLVESYLLFSYVINALWYTNMANKQGTEQSMYTVLARKQWQGFNKVIEKNELPLDSSILADFI